MVEKEGSFLFKITILLFIFEKNQRRIPIALERIRTVAATYSCKMLQLYESSTDKMRTASDIKTMSSVVVFKSEV